MSKNINGLTDVTNEAKVEIIRRKFLMEANTNPQFYHPIDIERCRSEDWQIERFLLEKGTPDEAYKALVRGMQWKMTFGVHERTHNYFPKELYQIFMFEKYSRDKEGSVCFWGVQRHYRKIGDFDELVKQFIGHIYEKLDRVAGNKKFISIADSQGITWSNADLSLAKFSTELLDYYPQAVKLGCTLDLPWIMNSLFKLMKTFLPKHLKDSIVLIKKEELTDFVDIDENELPVNFGGKRETIFDDLFDEMLPLYQLKHLNFSEKLIDKFYKVYNFDKN